MSSILDRISDMHRRNREQVAAGERFPVPGFDRKLWVHLRYLPFDENRRIDGEHGGGGSIAAMVEKLVVCCQGVYTSESGTDKDLVRVEHAGVPVGLDRDMAALLGFLDEVPKSDEGIVMPQDVVTTLMPREYEIAQLFDTFSLWLMVSSSEVDDDLVGESEPTQESVEQ